MRAEVLEGREPLAEGSHVVHGPVERRNGLAQAEVAGRPGARPGQVAGKEPVDRPLADPGQRGQAGRISSSGSSRKPSKSRSDRATPRMYSALRTENPSERSSSTKPVPRAHAVETRTRPPPLAEPLDEPVSHREGGEQRDLLGADRGHQRLEGVRRERRPQARETAVEPLEHGSDVAKA